MYLSARKVTFNIRSRKRDPDNSDELKIIQILNILVSSEETTTEVENYQWKRSLWHIEHRLNSVSGSYIMPSGLFTMYVKD